MLPYVFAQSVSGFVTLSLLFVAIGALVLRVAVVLLRPKLLRSRLRWITTLRGSLLATWVAALLYGQLGIHYVHACSFPPSREAGDVRLLVIADPQLTDRFAYPSITSWWAHRVIGFFCDLQLRISWRAAVWASDADAAIILGDLMWGAVSYSSRAEWDDAVQRLNAVFGAPRRTRASSAVQAELERHIPRGVGGFAPGIPTMVICGNHDVWMFQCATALNLPQLWTESFGSMNYAVTIGDNVTIVGLATPILQDTWCPGQHKQVRDAAWDWLDTEYRPASKGPVVLLSHIPTHRTTTECNARGRGRREGYQMRPGTGSTYQNFMDRDLTERIVRRVRPTLVLSGDAHDLCEVQLENGGGEWDVTLPSFSWLEGTYHHGYALLRVNGRGVAETHICWQPQQLMVFVFYACLGAVSVAALVGHAVREGLALRLSPRRILLTCAARVSQLFAVVLATFAATTLVA